MDSLARLIAIEDIKQLKARYFRYIDTRDFAGLTEVFCKEGTCERPNEGPLTGNALICKWIGEAYAQMTSVHHGHTHEVVIDSDTEAHGIIAMEDYAFSRDLRTKIAHGAGHYHEKYGFERGAWRIASMKLTRIYLDMFAPLPA
jgi:hypothetical protein